MRPFYPAALPPDAFWKRNSTAFRSAFDRPSNCCAGRQAIDEDVDIRSRIMYIECKAGNLTGEARIGRVTFSKTMKRIYYRDQVFQRLPYPGISGNHYEVGTGQEYWISGPKKRGGDRLFGERVPIEIDEDVRAEYWTEIRGAPERATETDASR